ncbi:hypothetical protein CHARACLAT_018151 [Characodon lateralis]|uniref:Uncharacterized protein n=1 Tax=Characodon lateralis TaxID=208331 RepID=A0ABU7EK52_9TELE|nr:hypothetical protein [Characodon lateralis]
MVSRTSLLTLFPPHHHDFSFRVWKIMFFMLQFKCSQPAYAQFGGVCSFSSWKPSRYPSLWATGLLGEILLVPDRLGAERNGHSNCAASFKISYLESRQPDVGAMMLQPWHVSIPFKFHCCSGSSTQYRVPRYASTIINHQSLNIEVMCMLCHTKCEGIVSLVTIQEDHPGPG